MHALLIKILFYFPSFVELDFIRIQNTFVSFDEKKNVSGNLNATEKNLKCVADINNKSIFIVAEMNAKLMKEDSIRAE